jgi:hypothetical protein
MVVEQHSDRGMRRDEDVWRKRITTPLDYGAGNIRRLGAPGHQRQCLHHRPATTSTTAWNHHDSGQFAINNSNEYGHCLQLRDGGQSLCGRLGPVFGENMDLKVLASLVTRAGGEWWQVSDAIHARIEQIEAMESA